MTNDTCYDPEHQPNAAEWFETTELERVRMVRNFHMTHRHNARSAKAHASVHVLVENQVAMGFGPTVRAVERLQHQGLSRHESLHAVESVLSEHLFSAVGNQPTTDSRTLQTRINAAIEQPDAEVWRKSQ